MKITYEEMTPAMQKAYRSTNTARKVILFICLAISLIVFFASFGEFVGKYGFLEAFTGSLAPTYALGGMVCGLVHCEFLFRTLFRKVPLILALPVCLFLYIAGSFAGFPLMILDLILFIRKKPLVYPFEHEYFLMLKPVQEEIEAAAYQEAAEAAHSENAAEKLSTLNRLREQGAITEDEYNAKKAELLEQI